MHSIAKSVSLVSFLLLSFPAISQSVIVNNGDTLICFPDTLVRQIIVDLEEGDLCQKENESYLRDIESLNTVIEAKNGQIANLLNVKDNLNGVIDEKNSQLQKQKDYATRLEKQRRLNLYKGMLSGTGIGVLIGILVML